ncbi:MAG: hypothetical protein RBU45_10815 [Myxococcota bacterium]|nr:hypothetical protein [Myxococcota bacterium]
MIPPRRPTFHEAVSKLRYCEPRFAEVVVGYCDRFRSRLLELSLPEFLDSEIPAHRARTLRLDDRLLWERRPPSPPAG